MVTRRNARQYPRTARLNRLLREIIGDTLETVDDDRLERVTVTSVEVEPDLRHAVVYYDTFAGEDDDELVQEGLSEARTRLQAAVARQARLKRVPELAFRPDPAVRQASRIEAILADLGPLPDESSAGDPAPDESSAGDPAPDESSADDRGAAGDEPVGPADADVEGAIDPGPSDPP